MRTLSRSGKALFLGLCLFAGTALADLPDPVAFSWAIERGDVKKVRQWLDEGLDPEFQGSQIGTGLMNAAWNGNIELMELFVARGANPRRSNHNGEQPLQLAAWNGHAEAVKWLLEHGAAINRDGHYWGALHYAVFNGHTELAKYLIERGANVNARSPNGSTPLMMAAREGREELAKLLLESGADTKSKNDWGDNALTLSMRYDHYRLGKMISSPEEFEIAVKAPKEDFGVATRSASAPSEIEELLRKIREAEAAGQPSEDLRAQLKKAIDDFRGRAIAQRNARRPAPIPFQSRSIVITAKRGTPGAERAEIVASKRSTTTKPPVAEKTDKNVQATRARIAELMRQIRLTEAEGRPATELRQQLYEAVESQK
ncbi:ankyrin repeat domain-containing protein [Propionivibrio limicola]|uniref:ankyrin repeat domain-containing protein n=1 Tax=Propionivibrio limicola TaxID=167645 RepID=UPI001478A9C7|nr:ankyrin repeat domain-containing protein [Propionivibrio limicola]